MWVHVMWEWALLPAVLSATGLFMKLLFEAEFLSSVTWDNENWQIYGRNIDILIWWWKKKLKLPSPGKPCRTDSSKGDKFPFENTKAKAPWHSKGSLQWSSREWVVCLPLNITVTNHLFLSGTLSCASCTDTPNILSREKMWAVWLCSFKRQIFIYCTIRSNSPAWFWIKWKWISWRCINWA